MTTDKDFKLLVRARMGRTGETYTAARAALGSAPPDEPPQPGSSVRAGWTEARREQRTVMARWFVDGRLRAIPARRKTRSAVLLELLSWFVPGQNYSEPDVNRLLSEAHPDVACLRRELVAFGYLQRDQGRYQVCVRPPERTARQRDELPAWERVWLPGFVAATGRPARL